MKPRNSNPNHRKFPDFDRHKYLLTSPAYRNLHIPKGTPFELEPAAGKGWGAFASQDIKRGALILREFPLFIIRKPHEMIMEDDLHAAFNRMTPRSRQQFLCVRDNASTPFHSFGSAFAENCFRLPVRGDAYGLYVLHSRLNHSCIPNAKIPDTLPGESVSSFAMRDIAAGEEITFCYESGYECRTRAERHRLLRFACACPACKVGTAFQTCSDMRRILVRGLQYLTLGRDLHSNQRDTAAAPIIFDPELKRKAETFNISLSSRLIYNLLALLLLEQEGLLDDFMIQRMMPGIDIVARMFETKSNVRIKWLAMAEDAWLMKFCVAMRLWGQEDECDGVMATYLREMTGTG